MKSGQGLNENFESQDLYNLGHIHVNLLDLQAILPSGIREKAMKEGRRAKSLGERTSKSRSPPRVIVQAAKHSPP